jgi:hypothetical protein
MDLAPDAKSTVEAIALVVQNCTLLAACHTIFARLFGALCCFLLRLILPQPGFLSNLSRYIQITLVCYTICNSEWAKGVWALIIRDEPGECLPAEEISYITADGLILLFYVVETLFF